MRITRRLTRGWLLIRVVIGLIFHPRRRPLFREMRSFLRDLPRIMQQPLPLALHQIALSSTTTSETETTLRHMADVAVLLDTYSTAWRRVGRATPLGFCLRQSLTRYRFLRPTTEVPVRDSPQGGPKDAVHTIDLPLVVHFGARFVAGKPDREISGHAWLTLNGEPYHESTENWRGFTIMWSYPETSRNSSHSSS